MKTIKNFLTLILLTTTFSLSAQMIKFVEGSVKDLKTKSVVSKAKFKIQNADLSKTYRAKSNSEGVFRFSEVPAGKYTLIVDDKTYNRKEIPFELKQRHVDGYTFTPFMIERKVSWMFNWGDAFGQEHYWSHLTAKIIIGIYFVCLFLVLFYSILQLTLAINYVKNKKVKEKEIKPIYDPNNTPKVTIQLPMFNELYVAERIIETVSQFDYPSDKFKYKFWMILQMKQLM